MTQTQRQAALRRLEALERRPLTPALRQETQAIRRELEGTSGAPSAAGAEGVTYCSPHAAELDRQMGIAPKTGGAYVDGNRLVMSAAPARRAS